MHFLNPDDRKIRSALRKHIDGLTDEVMNRLERRLSVAFDRQFINNHIRRNIAAILSSEPKELALLNKRIKSTDGYDKSRDDISYIFRYAKWFDQKKETKYNAYDLAENLNIQTCVYCNRIYTKTVVNPSKITRPNFDHWFGKKENPLLALSFFNLIPSCSICNSGVKGEADFDLNTHLHPYLDNTCGYKFSYYIKSINSYDFKIVTDDLNLRAETTVKAFKLQEIYETHKSEIKDLVKIRTVYSQAYLLNLNKFLNKDKTNVSMDEIYRLAFGTYKDETNFDKRPLSKLKRDILKELGII